MQTDLLCVPAVDRRAIRTSTGGMVPAGIADVDALAATVRAGAALDAHAAICALAGIDDDRARNTLGTALSGAGS